MKDTHGIILASNINPQLKELTDHRTVASLPFGGRYRIIDFTLSNLVNAGISDVGVVMWQNYQSLLDHLGSGRDWDLNRKIGGLRLLPPFGYAQSSHPDISREKLEALSGVTQYIKRIHQKHIVLCDGELIANLPVEEIIESHEKSGAGMTAVCTTYPVGRPETGAYFSCDGKNRVNGMSYGNSLSHPYCSVDFYVLEKSVLEKIILYGQSRNLFNLERDILLKMYEEIGINLYIFNGYAVKATDIQAFFKCNMDLLRKEVRAELFNRKRSIKTKVRDEGSTYYGPDSVIKNCFVADGCYIEGEIEDCIIFRGVKVEKGAKLKSSILMQNTLVRAGASLSHTITDKEVVINEGRVLVGHESYPVTISKGSKV